MLSITLFLFLFLSVQRFGAVFLPCAPLIKYRDYPEAKLQENLDAEIFGVLLEEAKEAFDGEMVIELTSETVEDVEENCERILQWIQTWRENQRKKMLLGGRDG